MSSKSLHIPKPPPILSQFTFLIHISTADNRTLPLTLDCSHQGSAGLAYHWSRGLPLSQTFFKYIFGVTEIPTTYTPPYFNYALVLSSSGKKNALCGLAY